VSRWSGGRSVLRGLVASAKPA